MHGLSDAQFQDMVASFLGPYYIALAIMNGLAALYLWRSNQIRTWASVPLPFVGKGLAITNALIWLVVALVFAVLAGIAGSGMTSLVSLPEAFREAINQSTGPVIYSVGTTVVLIVLFLFRAFFVKPVVAWANLELDVVVPRVVDDRPRLLRHRCQAR